MSLTIAATADLHLGMTFSAYPEVSEVLADARFESLGRLVEQANAAGAELLVIAGDLFDRPRVSAETIARTVSALAGFEGALIAVLPGNHDYTSGADSPPWDGFRSAAAEAKLPALLLDEPRPYDLRGYGVHGVLLPGPCTSRHRETNAIGWTAGELEPTAERSPTDARAGVDTTGVAPGVGDTDAGGAGDPVVIGVAHGSIEGISPDLEGRYYPMRPSDFERSRARLWIVGHTHVPGEREIRTGQTLFVPGTHEPDGFDCVHPGQLWIIGIDDDLRIDAVARETGRYRFREIEVEARTLAEVVAAVESIGSGDRGNTLLRLSLSGRLAPEEYRRYLEWREEVTSGFLFLRIDDDRLGEEMTRGRIDELYPVGSFPHRLLAELLEAGDDEAVELAHRYLELVASSPESAG